MAMAGRGTLTDPVGMADSAAGDTVAADSAVVGTVVEDSAVAADLAAVAAGDAPPLSVDRRG
jgi:hypothetical protein